MAEWLAAWQTTSMNLDFQQFHFLRPAWLILIPVGLLSCWYLSRQQAGRNSWRQLIDPVLLPHLLQGKLSQEQRVPLRGLALALVIAGLAMAGPSWEKLPQPVHKNEKALVILLDLSPSMLAGDLQPSRIKRAHLKLTDLLQQRSEGLTALIAYAGEAHTVSPLTDDTDTIISLLPALTPDIMPLRGSNTEMALEQALKLFRDAAVIEGDILLLTDGVENAAIDYLANNLPAAYRLSVLGIGTSEGAPIPAGNGGFARDNSGGIVLAKLQPDLLASLAQRCRGIYRSISPTDSDIEAFQQRPSILTSNTRKLQREFDSWQDSGAWLCLLLLPGMLLAFRRGWLVCLPLLLFFPEQSQAFAWDDLWYRKDQQAAKLMQQEKHSEAAESFQRPDWKGSAAYRAGNYQEAAKSFSELDTANADYNRGNALARSGQLQEALAAYDDALEKNPQLQDASANRELVESLLQQQRQQQGQQNGNQENQQQPRQEQQQSGDDSQQSDSQHQQNQSQGDQSSPTSPDENSPSNRTQENDSSEASQDPGKSEPPEGNPNEATQDQETGSAEEPQPQSNDTSQAQSVEDNETTEEQADTGAIQDSDLSPEERAAMEQWLRKIPDDPGGLMRRKFEYQYRQRMKEYRQGNWRPPENNANGRW